jgi:hypothetical protein
MLWKLCVGLCRPIISVINGLMIEIYDYGPAIFRHRVHKLLWHGNTSADQPESLTHQHHVF